MTADDALDHERKGANAGLNPMFGDWQHRFRFAPVSYREGGAKRAVFREAMQAELTNRFFYTGEIRLEITLHLDVQTVLETSDTADLDNYAKSIIDGLKGPTGIVLDDSQIQALVISYRDNYGRNGPFFDVEITASPDEFILKPVSFYEMPDRLWYPASRLAWTDGEAKELPEDQLYISLFMTREMSVVKIRSRHRLRELGFSRLAAYKQLIPIIMSVRGFHKGRIDSSFPILDLKTWQTNFAAWKADCKDNQKIEYVERSVIEFKEHYERLAAALGTGEP